MFVWYSNNTENNSNIINEVIANIRIVAKFCPEYDELNSLLFSFDNTLTFEYVKSLCNRYNNIISNYVPNNLGKKFSISKDQIKEELLEFIMTTVYRRAVVRPEKLNDYEAFSPNVYGESSFNFIQHLPKVVKIKPNQQFVDLGSGIGNVIVHIAALQICKKCIGIEKSDIPAYFAVLFEYEFKHLMSFLGRGYSDFALVKGNFLEKKNKHLIYDSELIFVNNYMFGPKIDHTLKQCFQNCREKTQIISSRAFCQMKMRVSDRSLSDIGCIMRVKELDLCPSKKSNVSWTDKQVSFYLHVIDSQNVEKYFNSINSVKLVTSDEKNTKKKREHHGKLESPKPVKIEKLNETLNMDRIKMIVKNNIHSRNSVHFNNNENKPSVKQNNKHKPKVKHENDIRHKLKNMFKVEKKRKKKDKLNLLNLTIPKVVDKVDVVLLKPEESIETKSVENDDKPKRKHVKKDSVYIHENDEEFVKKYKNTSENWDSNDVCGRITRHRWKLTQMYNDDSKSPIIKESTKCQSSSDDSFDPKRNYLKIKPKVTKKVRKIKVKQDESPKSNLTEPVNKTEEKDLCIICHKYQNNQISSNVFRAFQESIQKTCNESLKFFKNFEHEDAMFDLNTLKNNLNSIKENKIESVHKYNQKIQNMVISINEKIDKIFKDSTLLLGGKNSKDAVYVKNFTKELCSRQKTVHLKKTDQILNLSNSGTCKNRIDSKLDEMIYNGNADNSPENYSVSPILKTHSKNENLANHSIISVLNEEQKFSKSETVLNNPRSSLHKKKYQFFTDKHVRNVNENIKKSTTVPKDNSHNFVDVVNITCPSNVPLPYQYTSTFSNITNAQFNTLMPSLYSVSRNSLNGSMPYTPFKGPVSSCGYSVNYDPISTSSQILNLSHTVNPQNVLVNINKSKPSIPTSMYLPSDLNYLFGMNYSKKCDRNDKL
ncbi:H3-K79-HMTase [Intoshia linei]|uniref:Histone-lysine N-methyltransferase, H3 lysine-79 specific n=1 Tax=Intoshia linei TaxID=1819745 RepID=A0A177BDR9_9BILA|nr:H3-K79-HMTase [Intoshia linei]